MAFTIPTYDQLLASAKAIWRGLRTNADTGPGSDVDIFTRTLSHIGDGLHKHVLQAVKYLFPPTATDEYLTRWLNAVGLSDGEDGYGRLQAAGSYGTDCLRVTCTLGTPTITNEQLEDNAGRIYKVNEAYVFAGPGTADVDCAAITEGADTNLESGATLTFISPPAGITAAATLVGDLDHGRDLETDTEGQARLIDWWRYPSLSGNWVQWKRWVEAADEGNLDAWIYAARNNQPYGWGTTDIAATQRDESGTARVITSAQETLIDDYLEENAPAQMHRQTRVLTVSTVHKTVTLTYTLASGTPAANECDWDAENEKRNVIAETPGSNLIQVNAVYVTGPQSGERVLIAGLEAIVDKEPGNAGAPVSGAMDKFTVTTWPWSVDLATGRPSGSGFQVLSGGGLCLTVYDALQAYINSLGPAKCTYASPQEGWDDTIRIKFLQSKAVVAGGGWILDITDCKIDGVAADFGPSLDATSTVEQMIDDGIAVYEDK